MQHPHDKGSPVVELGPEFFRIMLDSVQNYAIFALDPEGRVANWNPGAEKVKGWKEEEVIGRYYSIFHTDEDNATGKPEKEIQLALKHGRYEEVGMRVRNDGSQYPARVSLAPMWSDEGELVGFVKVIENLTEQHARDQELKSLHENLERRVAERTRELETAVAQLESFSYSISHDLRGPLRAMEGFSSLLLDQCAARLEPQERHYLERIAAAARRMDRLVQDILSLSRIQRSKIQLHPLHLNRLIPEFVDQYHHLHQGEARIHIQHPLLDVQGHEPSLVQCLSNLLANAVKFAKQGNQPEIGIATEACSPGLVRIWVKDNGLGISDEDQQRIFGIFERGSAPKETDGTGIGLAIVKSAAERMGGSAGVVSELGKGSAFFVQLPAAPPHSV